MGDRIIIDDVTVVTMNDMDDVYFDGSLVIEGNSIVALGDSQASSGYDRSGATVIDGSGLVALPGLIDLHYHTALGKGWSDHLPLWEYLQSCWYPIIRALDDDAAYWAAMASYSESLKSGTTTVNDMYRLLPSLERAARNIGMRAVLCNDIAIDEENLDTLSDTEEAYREVQKSDDGLVEVRVGLEWLPLASEDLLRECRELANTLNIGAHIHLSESMSEVEICEEMFGKRPTEVAYDCGILGPDCIAAHCVWLTDGDIALLKETGTQVSHNPTSNAKLGNGIARLPELLEAGINVGLGHDAAECNNSRDMFQVMKWSSLIHRATRVDASLQQAPDVLRMATRNGASALGHKTGELSVGMLADVILVDVNNQYFTPLMPESKEHLYSHLVFSAEGACVDTSIVNGNVVVRGKEFVNVDEEEILAKAGDRGHVDDRQRLWLGTRKLLRQDGLQGVKDGVKGGPG